MDFFFALCTLIGCLVVLTAAGVGFWTLYHRYGDTTIAALPPFSHDILAAFAGLAAASYVLCLLASIANPYMEQLLTPVGVPALILYWLLLPLWVFFDARQRGHRPWAWSLMALFTNVLGLLGYLIVRGERPRACRRCGYRLRKEFVACPYCGPASGRACSGCQALLEPDWNFCPFCQTQAPAEGEAPPVPQSEESTR